MTKNAFAELINMDGSVLKEIFSVKFKGRHDSYSDQFSRIFMSRLLFVASVIMSVDYFSDDVNCMTPEDTEHSSSFYHSACWINGFYIFEEMRARLNKSGYYGIPQRVDYDGINRFTNQLCLTKHLFEADDNCVPMTRIYYLHYQWMPVYILSLSFLYYFPYILFRIANTDLISLKKEIKDSSESTDTIGIIRNYFNYSINTIAQLRFRIWWNLVVKIVYIFFSLLALYITDSVLMGRYLPYGKNYLNWYMQNNTMRHTLVARQRRANAGNELLPSIGYCDIQESSLETRITFHNQNRFICEISPHILYQYVLMVLWFCFIAGIVISVVGLVHYIGHHLYHAIQAGLPSTKQTVLSRLTLREIEYLDLIKRNDMVIYGHVLKKLRDERLAYDDKLLA